MCVALGDFDGVHIGHRALLSAVVENSVDCMATAYTFFENCKGARVITGNAEKQLLLTEAGIDLVYFDNFENIKRLTPERFVNDILKERLNTRCVICGDDFRFGADAAGDVKTLERLCAFWGIKTVVVDRVICGGKKLSSSDIRLMIECGDMAAASKALGRLYSVTGRVEHGKSLGAARGIPTVNLPLCEKKVIPAYGVYFTHILIDGKRYNGVSNVGVRPSVEDTVRPNVETNIFDFDGDLYDREITVEFILMHRKETKFDSTDALYSRICKDVADAKTYFNGDA